MITVELYDRAKNRIPETLQMEVMQYDSDAIGGPISGAFTVAGDGLDRVRAWLGYYVIFRNGDGTPVWWGKIKALSVDIGGILVNLSLDDIYNRVQVLYTLIDGDGYAIGAQTEWVQDTRSILTYGRHELRHAIGEASPQRATKSAERLLSKLKLPNQQIGLGSAAGATVRCEGLWLSLSQTYLSRTAGREVFADVDNAEQIIGWGVVSTVTGFTSGFYQGATVEEFDSARRAIQRVAGGLDIFNVGDRITVSGSAHNNNIWTVADEVTGKANTYLANTISFDPGDDINDSAGGLKFIQDGSFIRVTGSAANSRFHLIDEAGSNHVATRAELTGAIALEAAGPAITIEHGHMLPVAEEVTTEVPGATITLTGYTALAYSFSLSADNGVWPASEIWVRLRKIGAPTDTVKLSLYTNQAGKPGTLLDSATRAPMVGNAMNWVQFSMPGDVSLSYGATYWIVVERTGNNNVANYYSVGLIEVGTGEAAPHNGQTLVRTGNLWIARPKAAFMPFQIWGHTETTTQIQSILSTESQYTSGISVRAQSGLDERTFRDGATDALSELGDLLEGGTLTDEILLATVTPDWRVIVDVAPDTDPVYILRKGPRLDMAQGGPIAEGLLPVGEWVAVDGVGDVDALAPLSPFLLGYAEYNVRRGGITTMRAYGANSMFDFAKIAQG